MTTAGDTLYESGDVRVTGSMLTVGGSTYPLHGISNFHVQAVTPDMTAWLLALVASGLWGFVMLAVASSGESGGWFYFLIALVVAFISLRKVTSDVPQTHVLVLRTAGGDVQALMSPNAADVRAVASALAMAVADRG